MATSRCLNSQSAAPESRLADGTAEVHAGDEQTPCGVAAQLEPCAVDQQLRQAQLEAAHRGQHRARRDRRQHARQLQRRALLGVEQGHVAQLERRRPTRAADLDAADAHRDAERLAGLGFDQRAPALYVGQNRPMQAQPGQQQQAEECKCQPCRDPRQQARGAPRSGHDGSEGRDVRHGESGMPANPGLCSTSRRAPDCAGLLRSSQRPRGRAGAWLPAGALTPGSARAVGPSRPSSR